MSPALRELNRSCRKKASSPYMGDESKKLAPAYSALSTTARAFCSAAAPGTSNVCQVPIPITGTVQATLPQDAMFHIVLLHRTHPISCTL
jgi:hypothetical protein